MKVYVYVFFVYVYICPGYGITMHMVIRLPFRCSGVVVSAESLLDCLYSGSVLIRDIESANVQYMAYTSFSGF